MAKSKKYPKTIYGVWSDDIGDTNADDRYLRLDHDPTTLATDGESIPAAVYELVGYATIENATRVIPSAGSKTVSKRKSGS